MIFDAVFVAATRRARVRIGQSSRHTYVEECWLVASFDIDRLLESAKVGITRFLEEGLKEGRIDEGSYAQAKRNTFPLLEEWLRDENYARISPNLRQGIAGAIGSGQWEAIVNAFRQKARFGTGGIRGMMAFDRPSIELLASEGITAPVLKGPNTINDIVLLGCSTGVAQFGKAQNPPFEKVVIGYDSRIRGFDFARIVAELFLAYDYTVYFFDEPLPLSRDDFCHSLPRDQGGARDPHLGQPQRLSL